MDEVAIDIQDAVHELFGEKTEIKLTVPSDAAHGDLSTNVAMQLAKRVGKNPREIAEAITSKLSYDAEVAGPGFLNIKLSGVWLNQVLDEQWSESYGGNDDGAGKTVLVEYPSQNVAKPYSVGHLRPGNQGWAVKRLMEVTGWKVITDNHLGDYGAPFGIWVVGFLKFSSEAALAERGVYELGDVYIKTKKALKEEEAKGERTLANQVQDWLLRLEDGDAEATRYSDLFNEVSLKHIHDVMDRLEIETDYELGEKFFAKQGKAEVERLLKAGVFEKNSDGSVICRLDEQGIDVPLLVLKSNGAALYATTDLATMLYREKEFKPDRIIHAVGAEQKFYFEQLFAMAKKIGLGDIEMVHLWFGIIDQISEDGVREKMSSRKGVVLMEELLDQAEAKARETVKGRDVSEEDIKKIALGAIKFNDFTSDRRTNILFDWKTIFALTGFSGPYVQYATVRINKILESNRGFEMVDFSDYDFAAEKPMIKALLEYPDIVRHSANLLEPHRIAFFAHNLAKTLNQYYEKNPVNSADDATRSARLMVLKKSAQVMTHALDILGVKVPGKM
ncbi:MAG: arginine--tRNA ligase [Candidatus Nomurabacteria bacterium]|jgi:arginyl-tRNA synthetase|nr:arginine--tRNA ligase [Candidatus Nomurabacteria bacterium]